MASGNAEVETVMRNLELVSTSKRIAVAFEEVYRWMNRLTHKITDTPRDFLNVRFGSLADLSPNIS